MTEMDPFQDLHLTVGDEAGETVHVEDGMVVIGPAREDKPPPVLPLLPLDDFVLFPGMVAPIIVNTKRSGQLMEEVMSGSRFFIGALIEDRKANDETVGWKGLHRIGCIGRALKLLKFPDDTLRILIQGVQRATLTSEEAGRAFLQTRYDVVPEVMDASVELTALARSASSRFQEIIGMSPALPEELKIAVVNTEGPGRLADLIASNLNISLAERQKLLAEANVRERLAGLMPLLNRELEVLRAGMEIQNQVSETFSKSQREYFLREQLKAIQKELGEKDQQQSDLHELVERLAAAGLPEEIAKSAEKERRRLESIPTASPEYSVVRTYLELLSELPWNKRSEDQFDLVRAKKILDEDHYDLVKIKDRILEYLAVLKLKKDMKGPILCFVGPPGVGKTSLGQSIAKALGRSFIRVSLGGMRDEAEIRGHRRTYIGSMPGRIIQSLRKAGTRNPVFMLDEIDKLGMDFRGDPASALLEVLDPEQNSTFTDHYLDVPFDLSSVLFIATGNVMDTMPAPLRDRMEVIELPGYTQEEKVHIATRHLIRKQIAAHGLTRKQVTISKSALTAIISGYTREAGVRNLDRELAHVCRKAARLFAEGRTTPFKVTPDQLRGILGPVKFEPETAEKDVGPGVVTGLAWTPTGGDILFIESTRMPGKGTLILTGSLGDVMKESARAALSYLQANAQKYKLTAGAPFDQMDLHVHVPAGAIPKDGPSAGLAMLTSMYSLITGKVIPPTLAMTGEITLRGKIMAVGGVKEKVLAAARAGIRNIILPEGNRKDLEEIPPEVRRTIKFKCVRHADDALGYLSRLARKQS
ncbi:MAG: endopeptidase La [Verrucomicrobia bacterium]|nr:endopeptidase La [Kiritimatiellia bacterium]MCP5488953.1 endopeptidase La [Verrucomicrobiota bacterium]